jgi:hypothetical protein
MLDIIEVQNVLYCRLLSVNASFKIYETIIFPVGARGSVVLKALCYKPEGREFET